MRAATRDLRRRAASTTRRSNAGDRASTWRRCAADGAAVVHLSPHALRRGRGRRRQRGGDGGDGRGARRARASADRVPRRAVDAVRRAGSGWPGYRRGLAEARHRVRRAARRSTRASTARAARSASTRCSAATAPFTAIACANDLLALGALARLAELGIDVPGQVSVAGFDDIPMAAITAPSLSTVRLPLREMGRRGFADAARLAARRRRRSCRPSSSCVLDRARRLRRPAARPRDRHAAAPDGRTRSPVASCSSRAAAAASVPRSRSRRRREGATVAVHYHRPPTAPSGRSRASARPGPTATASARTRRRRAAEGLVGGSSSASAAIDGLVNNAGRTLVGPFLETQPAEWDEVIRTDLTAAFHTLPGRAAVDGRARQRLDRQHRVAPRPDGRRRDRRLQRGQGRAHRPDPVARARVRPARASASTPSRPA